MDYTPDQEAIDLSDKEKGEKALADEVMERCIRIVRHSCNPWQSSDHYHHFLGAF